MARKPYNFRKYDYSINKSTVLFPGLWQGAGTTMYRQTSRHTTSSTRSNFNPLTGSLDLKQNQINRTWQVRTGAPGVAYRPGANAYSMGYEDTPVNNPNPSRDRLLATAKAEKRFDAACRDRVLSLNEYFVERRSLADTLQNIVNFVKDAIIALKQRKFKTFWVKYRNSFGKWVKSPRRVELTFQEKWLQYNFALKPMMEDFKKQILLMTDIPLGVVRKSAAVVYTNFVSGRNAFNNWQVQVTESSKITFTGYISVRDPLKAIQGKIGADPLGLYEIMPLSFVIEWFFNMAQLLRQLCRPDWVLTESSVTERFRKDILRDAQARPPYSTFGGSYAEKYINYSRQPGSLPPIPMIWAGGIDSIWRLITSIALLSTLLSRKGI